MQNIYRKTVCEKLDDPCVRQIVATDGYLWLTNIAFIQTPVPREPAYTDPSLHNAPVRDLATFFTMSHWHKVTRSARGVLAALDRLHSEYI